MSSNLDPRHIARALAMQELFTELIAHGSVIEPSLLLEELEVAEYDDVLQKQIVAGVKNTYQQIDSVIQKLAPAWPIAQIAPVDLTILRMGIWEGFVASVTPHKVVINEMIELAKEFGGPSSSSFVNGVLGSLLNREDLQKELPTNQLQGVATPENIEMENKEPNAA